MDERNADQWEEFVEAMRLIENADLNYPQLQLTWKSWLYFYEKSLK